MTLRKQHNSLVLSCLICAGVVFAFGVFEESRGSHALLHWFVVPVVLCGILVVDDAVRWLTGEFDIFDPVGLIGLFGTHFFFLAPLLHLTYDYWLYEVDPPGDWRPWLGGMAVVNLTGLVAYRVARDHFRKVAPNDARSATTWKVRAPRFQTYVIAALLLGGVLQIAVYAAFGGIAGYIDAVEQKRQAFLGCSYVAMITESVPILALMLYVFYVWLRQTKPSWPTLFVVLMAFLVIKLLFGGLYGLRTNTVFAMFWAVGMVHFGIRPVPRKLILAGIVGLVAFMYLYGFYKSAGVQGLQAAITSPDSRADMEQDIGRPIESTLLGDLGRSDVQAYILYRQLQPNSDYQYGLGRTYGAALLTILPGPVWRDRPPTVVKEGTEALQGRGAYRPRPLGTVEDEDKYDGMSSKVYGLAGEAMLNFGALSVPVAFALLGMVVGYVSRWLKTWHPRDARRLLVPFLVLICIELVINDSYIVVGALYQFFTFPLLVVAMVSERRRPACQACAPSQAVASLPAVEGRMPSGGS